MVRNLIVLVLLALAGSTTALADPEYRVVRLLHPLNIAITIHTESDPNSFRQWVPMHNGNILELERDPTDTLPWELATYSTDQNNVADWTGGENGVTGSKTCCQWTCFSCYWSFQWKDCVGDGTTCTCCTLRCTNGWINCPAGTDPGGTMTLQAN